MDSTTPRSGTPEAPFPGASPPMWVPDPDPRQAPAAAARAPAPVAAGPSDRVRVRGGISISSAVTGAVVALAAMVLFTLLARAIGNYTGFEPHLLPVGGTHRVGLLAAVLSGTGLFVAFLWGGYTGARMGRSRGWIQGLLVAAFAVVIGGAGLLIAALLRPGPGLHLSLKLPSGYPLLHLLLPRSVVMAAAATIVLIGASLGGILGGAWHGRLERRALIREQESQTARESFRDLREALQIPEQPEPAPSGPVLGPPPRPGTLDPGVTA
jgi:hypothetical protein